MTAAEDAYANLQAAEAAAAAIGQGKLSYSGRPVEYTLAEQKQLWANVDLARSNYYTACAQERGGVQTSSGGGGEPQGKYTEMAVRDNSGTITGYAPSETATQEGSPLWYSQQIQGREAAAEKNTQTSPISPADPRYEKFIAVPIPTPEEIKTSNQNGEFGFGTGNLPFNINKRAGYTDFATIGDSVTQANMMKGMSLYDSLNFQLQQAYKTPSLRDDRYFANELSIAVHNPIEISSGYHHWGYDLNVPVNPNPFEYAGDVALVIEKGMIGKSSARGVSPIDTSAVILPYEGMGLQDVAWSNAMDIEMTGGNNQLQPSWEQPLSVLQSAIKNETMGAYGNLRYPDVQPGSVVSKFSMAREIPKISNVDYISSLPKPFMSATPYQEMNLEGPMGTRITSLAKMGMVKDGVFVPSKAGERKEPQPMGFSPVSNWMLDLGLSSAQTVDTFFSGISSGIPSGIIGSPIKAGIGFVEIFPQTATMIPLVGGAAFMFGQQPAATAAKAPSVVSDMAMGMYTRAIEQPERSIGNLVGMYYSPKIIGKAGEAGIARSPVGVSFAEIGSSSGATSKVLFGYTKPLFSPLETANIRGYIGLRSMSEPAMLQSSKAMLMKNTGIQINPGKIPYSSSVQGVRAELDALAGQQNAFLHGSNEIRFSQELLTSGKVVVSSEKPLFFAAKPNTLISRFIQGGSDIQPGSSTILRLRDSPKSVSDALKYGGTAKKPQLPPGLYPGTQPITGVSYKGMLQQELIVPSGTELSATGVGFVEMGGSRVTVIDIKIGPATLFEKFGFNLQKAEYKLNALELPKAGFGEPTAFIKSMDIRMANPLEEVASRQWSPSQKAVMYPYMKEMAREVGSNAGLRTALSGIDAMPILRETQFVQRELVGEILVGKDLSRSAIGDIYASRMVMGTDVVSGGSTTIRANLGKGFFDKSLIGDIDAWARANRVKGMWEAERTIIEKEIPDVMMAARKSEGATTFLDLKVGKEAQGKFPVGAISKPGSPKPIVEIHSIEQFPHVEKPANIGTMKAVGGAETTGMTTRFLGERKASAIFTDMYLEQAPGGKLGILPSPANIKHGVGASAIAREAASLQYGRDVALTGMKPSYVKGMKLERFASSMDEMLAETVGTSKTEVLKYQKGIAQNPLDLPVTQIAKRKAYAESGLAPVSEILGVGFNVGKREVRESYPRSPTYPEPTDYRSFAGMGAIAGYGFRPRGNMYPTMSKQATTPVQFKPIYPMAQAKTKADTTYPSVTQSIERTIAGTYPGVAGIDNAIYPGVAPVVIRKTDVTIPYQSYPTTGGFIDERKPASRQLTGGFPLLQARSASRVEDAIIGELKEIPIITRVSKMENPDTKLFRRKQKVWQYTNRIAADFLIAGKEGKPFRNINIHKNNFKKFKM